MEGVRYKQTTDTIQQQKKRRGFYAESRLKLFPQKYYTPFSSHQTPKILASLFSLQGTPSIHKILWLFQF